MRGRTATAILLIPLVLAGCTPPGPAPTAPTPAASKTAYPAATTSASTTTAEPTTPAPTAEDSLRAAFENPDDGGIGGFLTRHPNYLPATVNVGDEVARGSATGPIELTVSAPPGTQRVYMSIACSGEADAPYRMELFRDGVSRGASWADSCGYWGGLHGYTTPPFDPAAPPTQLRVTVAAGTRYSFVLYAVPAG